MASHLESMLSGHSLLTADIAYHLPDHPSLLQTFLWQQWDAWPRIPRLRGFLEWWNDTLDGKVHSVRVIHRGIVRPVLLDHASVSVIH